MSRFAIAVVAGLVVVGSVVALLPAQESSRLAQESKRRTATKFRSGPEAFSPPATSLPGLSPLSSPPAELAPIVAPSTLLPPNTLPHNLSSQAAPEPLPSAAAPAEAAPSINSPSAFQPPPQFPSAYQPQATTAAPPTEPQPLPTSVPGSEVVPAADEGQLRSVLKRSPPLTPPPTAPSAAPPRFAPAAAEPVEMPSASSRRAPVATPLLPGTPAPRTPAPLAATADRRSIQELALTGRSPALRVSVAGPQGITVGKAAMYTVNLANESDSPADEVTLRLALPGWVSVKGSQPTQGEVALEPAAAGGSRLVWSLPQVAAKSQAQLRLSLVSSSGESFDLGVEWTSKPAAMRAAIHVKQPQLELSLAGPADMTFGEEKTFVLTVSNPGTGDAERVVVNVTSGAAPAQQIEVGTLPAGTKKELPLAVVASQPGEMELRASATAEGGLENRTSGKVVVRKAEVSVAIAGPPLKFAGTEAVYAVTVSNTGSAAADNVSVSLALPAGAKFLGGIDGAANSGGNLVWKIASLAAGTERAYEVRVQLASPGQNRLVLQAQSIAGGNAAAEAVTEVEAVADLKLVVNDPAGPVPTGEQAIYEVQVMNRGSQAAQKVKIIMQFSDGIEPVSYEGCEARLVPGQVLCQPLLQLGAGEQVTLRVRAKALKAGAHQFRIEVTSTDGDTRLVSEGTTRFFSEAGRTTAAAATARKPAEGGPVQR